MTNKKIAEQIGELKAIIDLSPFHMVLDEIAKLKDLEKELGENLNSVENVNAQNKAYADLMNEVFA